LLSGPQVLLTRLPDYIFILETSLVETSLALPNAAYVRGIFYKTLSLAWAAAAIQFIENYFICPRTLRPVPRSNLKIAVLPMTAEGEFYG
jgi:hypothetical protein